MMKEGILVGMASGMHCGGCMQGAGGNKFGVMPGHVFSVIHASIYRLTIDPKQLSIVEDYK